MSQKKWSEGKKELERARRYHRTDITRMQKEIEQLRDERTKFRDHASARFNWWIELTASGKSPNLSWLIEHDTKFLQTVSCFSW